ncbi:hypothetical protein GW17_00046216 [Ensete ventricosum]|nr:hypothetical protein GW17_00046216 [Ensete ventricosum]
MLIPIRVNGKYIATLVGSIEPTNAINRTIAKSLVRSIVLNRALARIARCLGSGERPGGASLKRAAWAYSDKSRDYTVADTGILAAPQGSSEPIVSTGLQANPHVAGTFVSNMGMQQAFPDRQMPAWDPNKGNYGSSVAGTFPGQPFGPSAGALYPASAARPTAPAGYVQASQQMPHYGTQPRPAARGAPFIGHPPRYF